MAKIRINKLALELNIQNDQIIEALQKHDVAVKNHMSSIDEEATQPSLFPDHLTKRQSRRNRQEI